MAHLVPCSACGRHIFSDEPCCPFCCGKGPDNIAPTRKLSGRLGRAALFVAGATLMGAASCDGGSPLSPADGAADVVAVDGEGSGGGGEGGSGGRGTGGAGTGGMGSGGMGSGGQGIGGTLYGAGGLGTGDRGTGGAGHGRRAMTDAGAGRTVASGEGETPAARRSLPLAARAPMAAPALRRLPLFPDARDIDRAWRPIYAVWETTLRCDLACAHCGSRAGRARPDELSTAECLDLVRQMAELGVMEVTVVGGEAYLRDDWLDIIRAVSAAGMQCSMTTGGRGLTAERAQAAVAAGLNHASVGAGLSRRLVCLRQ